MARLIPWRDSLLLILLASIWGSSFLFIKLAIDEIPPLSIVAARVMLGGLALAVVVAIQRQALPREPRVWLDCLVVALVGNLGPFFLIAWGEQAIDSGVAAILMGTMPLSAFLLAHVMTQDEKLDRGKLLGIGFGLAGVVVLVGPSALGDLGSGDGLGIAAQLAIVVAGCGYALGGIHARRSGLTRLPSAVLATMVLLVSSLVILPPVLLIDRPWALTPGREPLLAMLGLGLLSTGLAFLILFDLLARRGVTFVALNNYMVPLFGLLWGALVLAEPVTWRALGGLGLILLGVGLVQARLGRVSR